MTDAQMQKRLDDIGISQSRMKKMTKETKAHTTRTEGEQGTRITNQNVE